MLLDRVKKAQLVLKGVTVNVDLLECFGRTTVEQLYENDTHDLLEVDYLFPLTKDDSITGFAINIDGDRTLKGVLKNRHVAKQEYEVAVQNKQVASFLEKDRSGAYRVKVGNVEPGSQVKVTFTYVTHLTMRDGKYVFVLPTNIAPKYKLNVVATYGYEGRYGTNPVYTQDKNIYQFCVNATWRSHGAIRSFGSLTHKDQLKYVADDLACKMVSVETTPLDGDFNLVMGTSDEKYPVVYCHEEKEDTFLLAVHKVDERDAKTVPPTEYIFLVDRSGSMEGDKMKKTCEALGYFIKSLPPKCHFNVVSFGSDFVRMYPESVALSDQSVAETLKNIATFTADLGGTEIFKVLQALLAEKSARRRCYFLLTDGQVSNIEDIATLIRQAKKPGDRCFALGVGADADRNLVRSCAEAGVGSHYMVTDVSDLSATVVQLLDDSAKEYYRDLTFTMVGADGVEHKVADLLGAVTVKQNFVIPNSEFVTGLRLPTSEFKGMDRLVITALPGSAVDEKEGRLTWNVPLNTSLQNNELVRQVYGRCLLEDLEGGNSNYQKTGVTGERLIELIVATSLKYSILCQYTGFVVVSEKQIKTKDRELVRHRVPHFDSRSSSNDDGDSDGESEEEEEAEEGEGQMDGVDQDYDAKSIAMDMDQLQAVYSACAMSDPQIVDSISMESCAGFGMPDQPVFRSMGAGTLGMARSQAVTLSAKDHSIDSLEGVQFKRISRTSSGSTLKDGLKNMAKSVSNFFSSKKSKGAGADSKATPASRPGSAPASVAVAETKALTPTEILNYQKSDGSFTVADDLLSLLGTTKDTVKTMAEKYGLDYELMTQIYVIQFLESRAKASDKLILKKLRAYVAGLMNGDAKKMEGLVAVVHSSCSGSGSGSGSCSGSGPGPVSPSASA